MAKGIIDCEGNVINIGDRVKTEHGDVIEVQGGMVSEHALFNAEKCKKVDKTTKLSGTGKASNDTRAIRASDCIIWGT